MTSRQLRTERRAAERKAQKLERKRLARLDEAAFLSEPKTKAGGPRTPEGKLASSRNSLKHGLASGSLLIPGEDPAVYQELLESLLAEHAPADRTEELLVQQLAQSHWLSQRALRLQNECFLEDGVDEKRLALFLRYFTTHERAFHKALNSLMRLQKERRKLERQFVSQNQNGLAATTQFVSQNEPRQPDAVQFVLQNPAWHSPEEPSPQAFAA